MTDPGRQLSEASATFATARLVFAVAASCAADPRRRPSKGYVRSITGRIRCAAGARFIASKSVRLPTATRRNVSPAELRLDAFPPADEQTARYLRGRAA